MTIANRGHIYQRVAIDSRRDLLKKHRELGTDGPPLDEMDAHLTREGAADRLRDDLRPEAIDQSLMETAAAVAGFRLIIDAEARAERQEVAAAISREGETAQSVQAASSADFDRARESDDINELRMLVDRARRAGPAARDRMTAILVPRLRKKAGVDLGIARSMAGPVRVTSDAFDLLNELTVGLRPLDERSRLDAVTRRAEERWRRILEAATAVDPRLPNLIRAAALRAAQPEPASGGLIVGRYWQEQRASGATPLPVLRPRRR